MIDRYKHKFNEIHTNVHIHMCTHTTCLVKERGIGKSPKMAQKELSLEEVGNIK
jgi:hypothetical protein